MTALARTLRRALGRSDAFAPEPAMEVVYRDLFARELARLGEEDRFFPVGGAANHSLLYLILRVACEFRPASVLDVGAGQSSLLWSALRRRGLVGDVLTLEHDAEWGARIAAQVDHPVLVTPLRPARVDGVEVETYDWDQAFEGRRFEVVGCDGPIGATRHSRRGVLAALEADRLPADFLVILDDAERPGEQDTVRAVHDRLGVLSREYAVGVFRAAKSQAAFAGGRFRPAAFL